MQLVMWEERPGRSCLNRPRAPDRARALSPARPTHSYNLAACRSRSKRKDHS